MKPKPKPKKPIRVNWVQAAEEAPQAIDPELARRIQLNHLLTEHGSANEQKDKLVARILSMFESPGDWPLTDAERIGCIKEWFLAAKRIRQTERLSKP